MSHEPAPSVPDILQPAYDALDAAKVRCREMSERIEALAGPDVTTALLAWLQAEEDSTVAHQACIVGGRAFKDAPPDLKAVFSEASAREYQARTRLLALGRAIRTAHEEKASAAQ